MCLASIFPPLPPPASLSLHLFHPSHPSPQLLPPSVFPPSLSLISCPFLPSVLSVETRPHSFTFSASLKMISESLSPRRPCWTTTAEKCGSRSPACNRCCCIMQQLWDNNYIISNRPHHGEAARPAVRLSVGCICVDMYEKKDKRELCQSYYDVKIAKCRILSIFNEQFSVKQQKLVKRSRFIHLKCKSEWYKMCLCETALVHRLQRLRPNEGQLWVCFGVWTRCGKATDPNGPKRSACERDVGPRPSIKSHDGSERLVNDAFTDSAVLLPPHV